MHMADALISPEVGGTMLAAGIGIAVFCGFKVKQEIDEKKIPLMGVMGAFIFAAQMINFAIPGTGSSGHLGGGLILAAILGPYAGFLSMAVILLIQALVFADGGLLAFGCNVFNLAFFASFIVYPFIYKPIIGRKNTQARIMVASVIGSIMSLQLGSFAVVLETLFSRKTELPFGTFVLLMQPIHLVIGTIEGIITGAILGFVRNARPEILESSSTGKPIGKPSIKMIVVVFSIVAALTAGALSWFASKHPDGLEWSMLKTSGKEKLESRDTIHRTMSSLQDKTALLPDYGFKPGSDKPEVVKKTVPSWPNPDVGTTLSGLVGGAIVFASASCIGFFIWLLKRRKKTQTTG
jgi:cobalt/nickel transport system permease protein